MKRKNLYTETGEPKRIRCYWSKTGEYSDPITIVFTYAHCLDKSMQGRVYYIGMTEQGSIYHGDMEAWKFKGCGSIVKFSELPLACQEVVKLEYKDFWEVDEDEQQVS